jgi:hypothetical protein
MSAPTELDSTALRRGLFVPLPRATRRGSALRLVTDERRSLSPVATLSRDEDQMCRDAVDPAEIAAGLEATGLSDRAARESYGAGNIFELAEVLYALVPRRLSPALVPRDPWSYPFRRHLGRGILYALPTFPYLAALQVLGGQTEGVLTLLVGSVLALAATHGLSHLGHLLVGYGAPGAAARVLRRAVYVTVATGVLAMGLLCAVGLPAGPLAIAVAQLVYVVAATAVMVFERERLLFLSLLPGVAVSAVALGARDLSGDLRVGVAGGLVVCVLLAVTSAVWTTRAVEREAGGAAVRLVRQELLRSVTHAAYGAMVAALLMYAVLDALLSRDYDSSSALVGVGMLPLVVTLGISEWQLHMFRSDSELIQHRTHDFQAFARQVRLSLFLRVAAYGLVLVVVTTAVLMPVWADGTADATMVWRLVGYAVLGMALFVSSILLSCGLVGRTVAAVAATVLVQAGLLVTLHASIELLTVAQATVFAMLFLTLWTMAVGALGSPLRFR